MLGDVRLVHLDDAQSVQPPQAAAMNHHLDGILCSSELARRTIRNSGVWLPIGVIPPGIDDFAAAPSMPEGATRGPVSPGAPFTFLHAERGVADGQFDIPFFEAVLTAYCLAFSGGDPVLMVMHTTPDKAETVEALIKRIAGGRFSPPVQLICEALPASEIDLLHGLADAAILPADDEGDRAGVRAMALGVPIIAVGRGGHLGSCSPANALLVDYSLDVVTADPERANAPFLSVSPSVSDLIAAMRETYRDGRSGDTPTGCRVRRGKSDAAARTWHAAAVKLDAFVVSLDKRPVMNRKIRLGWVSTYNSRCGLATHSEHLLENFDRNIFDVTVIGNHQEPVKPDPANVVRLWPDRSGSLATVRDFIGRFDAVFVNFHFSLIEIRDLAETLHTAHAAEIDTYVTLHKTADTTIDGRVASLGEIADALRACTRLIVHTELDIARLKGFGVADNVVMIPPGVIDRTPADPATARSLLGLQRFRPIIGTFGFMLPPKGLQQLIHGFALLLRHHPDALLLMLNAEFPGAVESSAERERCIALIRDLGLEDRVRLIDEFLETDEILLLLNACDVTIFTYQDSTESDSGAVRLGLAAGRPVATTPLPIFANLAEVVYQLAGTGAVDIADGIATLLRQPEMASLLLQRQRDWIVANSWSAQAARIGNIIRGCFEDRHGAALYPPPPIWPRLSDPEHGETREADNAAALREMIELLGPASAAPVDPDRVGDGWTTRQVQ
jgi:glycosyltransferase involved in cell wall biosynthesis